MVLVLNSGGRVWRLSQQQRHYSTTRIDESKAELWFFDEAGGRSADVERRMAIR
jgi:hypothetical protein